MMFRGVPYAMHTALLRIVFSVKLPMTKNTLRPECRENSFVHNVKFGWQEKRPLQKWESEGNIGIVHLQLELLPQFESMKAIDC